MIIIERVFEPGGAVALWSVDIAAEGSAKSRQFIGYEQPVRAAASSSDSAYAVCWSYGSTIGNVEIFNGDVLAALPGRSGKDALIGCDVVEAGRMRNGAKRWWCRTHQTHWGTKADIAAAHSSGEFVCSNRAQPMSFVVNPPSFSPDRHAEVGVWCSMPPAITSAGRPAPRRPKIHVHIRDEVAGEKVFDGDVDALTIRYGAIGDLFAKTEMTAVNITPPAAFDFVTAIESGRAMGYIACKICGAPHLDLGAFSRAAHSKHLCGNCGRDSIRSTKPMISTPLKPLYDQFTSEPAFTDVDRNLNIDDYPSAEFAIWASTPALLWTSRRPQERGIHVHLSIAGKREIDETFGSIIFRGEELNRSDLLTKMIANTLS